MSNHKAAEGAVSRRSARMYVGEHDPVELGHVPQGNSTASSESRYGSSDETVETERVQRDQRHPSSASQRSTKLDYYARKVDLGRDLSALFPSVADDQRQAVIEALQSARDCLNENVRAGRPKNFGVVVPDTIYRSSFPLDENHDFVRDLGLKTVVTLVDKEYPPEYLPFLKALGVRHIVIDMKGTKKVPISEDIIRAVIRTALDTRNHPLLVHCNHGRHRTGCAIAVIRHVAGWDVDDIIEEYSTFADPKVRECDIEYINNFELTTLHRVFAQPGHVINNFSHNSRTTRVVIIGVVFLIVCTVITFCFK